ncbi:MAG TPA: hypothetical protein VI522_02525 [Gammaproteobacteria bacterium]|nr:hypothetical protein [Gammaproteobacteria bacterium]
MQQALLNSNNSNGSNNSTNNRSNRSGGGANCNCSSGDCSCCNSGEGCVIVAAGIGAAVVGSPLLLTQAAVCLPQYPQKWVPDCIIDCSPCIRGLLPESWTFKNASAVAVKAMITLYLAYQFKNAWEASSPWMCTVYDPETDEPVRDPDGKVVKEDCSELYYLFALPLAGTIAFVAVQGAIKLASVAANYCCNSYATTIANNSASATDLETGQPINNNANMSGYKPYVAVIPN